MSIILMLALVSCQKEFTDIREPDKGVTISPDDAVAELILNVVLRDGSFDNMIDRCNEISINFPYSIQIGDQPYTIDSREDIDVITLDHFYERDDIEIIYPVSISYSDYTEEMLSDPDELELIQERYNSELSDDDNECLDFVFPIEIALYDAVKQTTDVLTADNDLEMYGIFSNMDDLLVEIEFPIELASISGDRTTIQDNFQLEDEIRQFDGSCDEEDDVEFSDEDYPLMDLISSGEWHLTWYSDTTNETSAFSGYTFAFSTDLSVRVNTGGAIAEGAWEPDAYDASIFLEMSFDTDETPLVWLNHEWKITHVNSHVIEGEAESDFDGYVKTLHLARSDLK